MASSSTTSKRPRAVAELVRSWSPNPRHAGGRTSHSIGLTLLLLDISAEHGVRPTIGPISARGLIAALGPELGGPIRSSPRSEPDHPAVDLDVGSGEFLSPRSTVEIRGCDSIVRSPRSSGPEPTGRSLAYEGRDGCWRRFASTHC